MLDFTFYSPTRIDFGRGALGCLADEVRGLGASCVLVVYAGAFLEENGVIAQVTQAVEAVGARAVTAGEVLANPTVESVGKLVADVRGEEVDAVLAVGGGSTIDSAKAAAACLACPGLSLDDLLLGRRELGSCLPVGVVLTLAGSGSESSCSVVLTMEGGLKRSFDSDLVRPRFAVLDPRLTFSLPARQTAAGACDILMHAMERYFSPTENTDLIDRMAEGLMEAVIGATRKVAADPADYEVRATLMWAGTLAHNGLLGTGRVEDWACHRLEHELSGLFGVTHGAGLCAVWGSWAGYVRPGHPGRFATFARRVLHVDEPDDDRAGLEGIERLVAFFREVGMPTNLPELGCADIDDETIALMTRNCLLTSETIGGLQPLGAGDVEEIYRRAGGVCDC